MGPLMPMAFNIKGIHSRVSGCFSSVQGAEEWCLLDMGDRELGIFHSKSQGTSLFLIQGKPVCASRSKEAKAKTVFEGAIFKSRRQAIEGLTASCVALPQHRKRWDMTLAKSTYLRVSLELVR